MKRYLPLLLLLSGCGSFESEPNQKPEPGTEWDVKIDVQTKDEDATPSLEDPKVDPKPQPSNFEKFTFERSENPIEMSYGNWQIDGDLLSGTIQGTLLLGFPDMIGNLDDIGDWNLNFRDPCINILNYDITSVAARGSVEVDQISQGEIENPTGYLAKESTTLYKISPYGEGDAFVVIRADYLGWERPSFANSWEIKEGCEDPTYPQKLLLRINLNVQQPDGATVELPEACSENPTFSEQTDLPFSSYPTKNGKKIDALNWTKLPSFEVQHSKMDLSGDNVEVQNRPAFSNMEPGEMKIINEFGDETIIRVAPFSETESYKLFPLQRDHTRAPFVPVSLSEPLDREFMLFGFAEATFATDHCTVQTPTIIESKTPEVCETVLVKDQYFWIDDNLDGYVAETALNIVRDGECIVEASTVDGSLTQTMQMTSRP